MVNYLDNLKRDLCSRINVIFKKHKLIKLNQQIYFAKNKSFRIMTHIFLSKHLLNANKRRLLALNILMVLLLSCFIGFVETQSVEASPTLLLDDGFENPSDNYDPFNFSASSWTNLTVGGPEGCIAQKSTNIYAPDGSSTSSLYLSCLLSDRLYLMTKDTGSYRSDIYAEGWVYITNYTLNIYQFGALHTSFIAFTQNISDKTAILASLGYANISGTYKFGLIGKGLPSSVDFNAISIPTQENVWYHFALQVHIGTGDGYVLGWLSNSIELGTPQWKFTGLTNSGDTHNIVFTAGRSGLDFPAWFIEDAAYYLDSLKVYDSNPYTEIQLKPTTQISQPSAMCPELPYYILAIVFVLVVGTIIVLFLKERLINHRLS